jgi:peptide/nickel transport system substrate-binding protein
MYIYRWDDNPEPDAYIYPLFHSQARGYYYKNLSLDTLINKASIIVNREEREKAYHYLSKVIHDDAPWVFLWVRPTKFGVSNDLDWQPDRLGYTKMKYGKFIK